MKYVVQQNYRDYIDHQPVDLTKGETVELDEAQAAQINANAPGTLKPQAARAEVKPGADRQVKKPAATRRVKAKTDA